jgi:hypothetical protein
MTNDGIENYILGVSWLGSAVMFYDGIVYYLIYKWW